jgi:hypothetical protein
MFKGNGSQALYIYHDAIISSQQNLMWLWEFPPFKGNFTCLGHPGF